MSRLALPIANCTIGETVSNLAKGEKLFANLTKRFYGHINAHCHLICNKPVRCFDYVCANSLVTIMGQRAIDINCC